MSFKKFNFNDQIIQNIDALGYVQPTPIQEEAIGPILEGHDVLGLAQTGTGKTAAFSLPILQQLSQKNVSAGSVRALIVAPTRELAEQTATFLSGFSAERENRCCVIYGGVSKNVQIKKLQKGVEIVVACPGRLLDLVNTKDIDLSKVETLVLDEADQMLDKGFFPDIKRILKVLPRKRQNLVFSATMPTEVRSLVEGILRNPVKVAVNHTQPITRISHTLYQVENSSKPKLLESLLSGDEVATAIVFTRTKYKAKNLANKLSKKGFKATSLQGNLSQQRRQQALDGFKDGTFNILVATDIAARGIDVAGISHVINYDMPDTSEAYTHRSGRTGRANLSGHAITFATAEDNRMVKKLRTTLSGKLVMSKSSEGGEEQARGSKLSSGDKSKAKKPNQQNRKRVRGSKAKSFDFGIRSQG